MGGTLELGPAKRGTGGVGLTSKFLVRVQVLRNNGEIFAVSHPHRKTGYKNPNSETNVTALGGKT